MVTKYKCPIKIQILKNSEKSTNDEKMLKISFFVIQEENVNF